MPDAISSQRKRRVRTDQPTIVTLEETMTAAHAAVTKCFDDAGFTDTIFVINVVVTSLDPDDDYHTWAAGSRAPDGNRVDQQMLGESLRRSADEVWPHAA